MTTLITTYLQDHHAGAAAGVDAFKRVAQGHSDTSVREAASRIGAEAEEDQKSLEAIMELFGAEPAAWKDVPARVAEKVARLKPNQRLKQRSPLSDVLEAEALVDAVHAKSLCWVLLLQLDDERLDRSALHTLLERAQAQEEELRKLHAAQAPKLLQS